MSERLSAGRLLVVGTPIGNLGDLSPRAAAALRAADLVVAEDTRLAARLLHHLVVERPTLSFNEHNAAARLPGLLARLRGGATLALTTDAGMPGVSDPGASLVAAARAAGAAVEVLPGPSAVTAAIAGSGIAAPGFLFGGFLPSRPPSQRRVSLVRLLEAAGAVGLPLVLFEAPHRVGALVGLLAEVAAEARLVVAREISKRHEEVLVGRPAELAERLSAPRGEFVVIVPPPTPPPASQGLDSEALAVAAERQGLAPRVVVELLRAAGVSRREAYRRAHESGSPVAPVSVP